MNKSNKINEEMYEFTPSTTPPSDQVNQVNLETQVFRFQRWTLQLFGFAPGAARRSFLIHWTMRIISIFFIIAAPMELFYQIAVFISQLRHPPSEEENNVVLTILVYAPYIAESARGLIVLVIVVSKRKSWQHLAHFADEIFLETFPESKERNSQLRRWGKFALIFGVGMIIVHFFWEVIVFQWDSEGITLINPPENINNESHGKKNWPEKHKNDVTSFEEFISEATHDLWWNIAASCAEAVPFCLTQQIFVIIIVLAFLLNAGARKVNGEIETLRLATAARLDVEEAKNVYGWEEANNHRTLVGDWNAAELTEKVAAVQNYHLRLVLFSHEINHFFGWILFVVYGMDVVSLIGFVALLVTEDNQLKTKTAFYLISIVMFGFFATVFYVPLVQAQEEAAKVTTNLHHLIGKTAKIQAKESHIQSRLEVFCIASKQHTAIFEGAGLLHVTRIFIVTTFTMTLSIGILAYEILNLKEM